MTAKRKTHSQEKRKSAKLTEEKIEVSPNSSTPDTNDLDEKIKELKRVRKYTFIGFAIIISVWLVFFISSIMYLNSGLKDDVEFYKNNVCISKDDFNKLFKTNAQINEYDGTIEVYGNPYIYDTLE
jgi:hypothetical protein